VGLLDHTANRVFQDASILLSRVVALLFPPAVYEGSFIPISLPTHLVGGVFDDGYSNRGEAESVWFLFAFLLWYITKQSQ
jgi:hypothetical protein